MLQLRAIALNRSLFVALGILLAACSGAPGLQVTPANATLTPDTPLPTQLSTDPSSVIATPGIGDSQGLHPSETPTPSVPQPPQPLSQYTLSATLDYDAHTLTTEEEIAYVNHTGATLSELLLLVEPNRYPGGFTLASVSWKDGEPVAGYALAGVELRVPLREPLPPDGTTTLSLSFTLVVPNQNAPYGYTARQTNLGDWYPYVPPYVSDGGWLVREDAFYGEHLAYDVASFEVEIRLTNPTAASGVPLTIAASSERLPENGEEDLYRYRHSPARNFVWTISDQYKVNEAKAGDFTVKSYTFPSHPLADGPALEETVKALTLFDELYAPYPHATLSVVEADFLDGMEFDGLIFLSHAFYDFYTGDQKSNLTIIAAHEVAHQWWYGLVGNDQAMEPWLDEALATFSELYFYENVYPDLAAWYWENRVTVHAPQGWIDSKIYDVGGFYPYRDAVYLRGAMFLRDLRDLMGAEAFLDFLHDYLQQYSYRQVTADDFFALLSEHTQADLSGLLGTYFENR
jgi:hypothetical protein